MQVHDLGKLLLAFVMLWAYINLSQFLIIWSGNLPEEIPLYIRRLHGGWQALALVLVLFHFALPFLLLLSRDLKRNARLLGSRGRRLLRGAAGGPLLAGGAGPAGHGGGFHPRTGWTWPRRVGVGGLWLWAFARELRDRPLLPVGEPELRERLEGPAHDRARTVAETRRRRVLCARCGTPSREGASGNGAAEDAAMTPHYEKQDVEPGAIVRFGAILAVVTVLTAVLLWPVFSWLRGREASHDPPRAAHGPAGAGPPAARAAAAGCRRRRTCRRRSATRSGALQTYGWVDEDEGIVHIPIDEAMRCAGGAAQPLPRRRRFTVRDAFGRRSPRDGRREAPPAGRRWCWRAAAGAAQRAGAGAPRSCGTSGFDQRLGQTLPLDLAFRDEAGRAVRLGDYFGQRPVVLSLVYYECPMLCTLTLNGLVSALSVLSFDAGREFEVVTVSFDPRETPALAAAKKKAYLAALQAPGAAAGLALPDRRRGRAARAHPGGRLPLRLGRGRAGSSRTPPGSWC